MPDRLINPNAQPGSFRQIAFTLIVPIVLGYGSGWLQNRDQQNRMQYTIDTLQQQVKDANTAGQEAGRQREALALKVERQDERIVILLEQMRDIKSKR